jgi:hypothetical protein
VTANSQHPYRRAAARALIVTLVAWAAFMLPTKVFHSDGSPPGGYISSAGYIVLLPGAVASLFVYYPGVSTASLVLWQGIVATMSWLFYFGLLSMVERIRRPRPEY